MGPEDAVLDPGIWGECVYIMCVEVGAEWSFEIVSDLMEGGT